MKARLVIAAVMVFAGVYSSAGMPVPPHHHPRLYLDSSDVPALRQRMNSARGAEIISKMQSLAAERTAEEELPVSQRDFRYYFQMRGLTSRAELQALDYLANGNVRAGREAVVSVLDSLKRTAYGVEKDLSRANGVMLMVGAIVYDWCYPLLSNEEKSEYISQFLRISSLLECGYPFKFVESIAGHTCEWMIMRDMLSAAVAIYDEYPALYQDVIGVIEKKFAPSRNLFYEAGNHPQGTKYIPTRLSSELFAQLIVAKIGGGKGVFSNAQRNVLYDIIYRMRPDGTLLPIGDENPSRKPRTENYALPAMMASYFYRDPHLRWLFLKDSRVVDHSLLFELLWNDDSIEPASPDDLPLVRFCPSPFGWMIARTGWGDESVIAEMKVNEQMAGNHQHLDGGSFQIWYKGSLAIDSGVYEGVNGGYRSKHCFNYTKRTIAHNSLIIFDPDEKFAWYKARPHRNKPARYCSNDGGQRMPGPTGWDTAGSVEEMYSDEFTVGRTLYHGIRDDFSWLKGDITKAYSDKVDLVERSFVFCDMHDAATPAFLVIFDRVGAKNPALRKSFLLHSIEKPELRDGGFVVKRSAGKEDGMLSVSVLLPEKAGMSLVGGPGREYEVDGTNWPNVIPDDTEAETGAWRVEVSPSSANRTDVFLNVIQISSESRYRGIPVQRMDCGSHVAAAFGDRMVLFSRETGLSAAVPGFRVDGTKKILVCDMQPGRYDIRRNGKRVCTAEVKEGEDAIEFSARKGKYEIEKSL